MKIWEIFDCNSKNPKCSHENHIAYMTAIPKNPNKVKKTREIFDRKPPKSQMQSIGMPKMHDRISKKSKCSQWKRQKRMTEFQKNLNEVNESTKSMTVFLKIPNMVKHAI